MHFSLHVAVTRSSIGKLLANIYFNMFWQICRPKGFDTDARLVEFIEEKCTAVVPNQRIGGSQLQQSEVVGSTA